MRSSRLFCSYVYFIVLLLCAPSAFADEILVSAASSLTDAFQEIGTAFQKTNPGKAVRFNFGASGAVLQQIRQGAPVDIFASASPKEMDLLAKEGRLLVPTRHNFTGNRLVLIVPAKQVMPNIRQWEDLKWSGVNRIALSNPASVPSGHYAREVLIKRGVWDSIQQKAILGENVRQALTYVAGGNVDAGIVFATDAKSEAKRVRVIQQATPDKDHAHILYPVAVLKAAPNPGLSRLFIVFLMGPKAQAILQRYGFASPNQTPPSTKQRPK